jgi:hypothetical protein
MLSGLTERLKLHKNKKPLRGQKTKQTTGEQNENNKEKRHY